MIYIVIKLWIQDDGDMAMECYGPFESEEVADQQRKLLPRNDTLTRIELLWGDIGERK
jgi:hypothetical protein